MTLTRRQTLIGATATVAAAALPAVVMADAVAERGVVLTGSRDLFWKGSAAKIGDWYWDYDSRHVLELTETGWKFLFNLHDGEMLTDAGLDEMAKAEVELEEAA
jgi:hypothetical protein